MNRIISAILVLASLLSVFAVFASASGAQAASVNSPVQLSDVNAANDEVNSDAALAAMDLIYKRNFSEGWDYANGFSKMSNHKAYIDYEETVTRKYNYFWRIEATSATPAGTSGITMIDALRESGTVFQFKIKADDACSLGRIMYFTTAGGATVDLLHISGNSLYAFKSGTPAFKIHEMDNEWLSIAMVFDWDATKTLEDDSTLPIIKCRIYYGDEGAYFDYEADYTTAGDIGWRSLYFAIPSSTADREGMSYCIDDLAIYNRVKEPLDLSNWNEYGSMVNYLDDIVIDIQDGPGKKSREQMLSEALCMKVRVNTALRNNKKVYIADDYCAPEIVDGNVMVPLNLIVDYMGYDAPYVHGPSYDISTGTSATYITIGRNTAKVGEDIVTLSASPAYLNDIPVIAAADIPALFPGWLMNYDDMGLIVVYEGDGESTDPLLTREKDLDTMLELMKSFVFDIVTKDENGNDFEAIEDSYKATGNAIISDMEKHSASHPYIYTNQQTFDSLNAAYFAANSDAQMKAYLDTLIAEADAIYAEYAISNRDGSYNSFNEANKPVNLYADGIAPDDQNPDNKADTTDGYAPNGTFEDIKEYSEQLVTLAFAYQITRKAKYADLAYDLSLVLGQWTHWGPADMASCATATGNFTVAYDWLYNYYMSKEDGDDRISNLVNIIYTKGFTQGYNASFGKPCEFPKAAGGGDVYNNLTTYVNVVSSANMIIASLALAEYDGYKAECADLIGNNLQNLIANGLDQYAPDGSYAESAVIWADATNGFLKLIMAFESAIGTTYGFEDTWGIDKTFYFAYYIEDSDGNIWNYHEGGPDGVNPDTPLLSVDTQMFNYAGKFLNDSTLLAIRKQQLGKGKNVTVFDMLFYPEGDVSFEKELSLDYYMQGINAFVSRSDWEAGALYTGIMGGANDVYGGQLDSGNFIYRNKGISWIIDLGSDNPEIYSYYGEYRYRHYRHNADGQNVMIINTAQDSIPYGQLEKGNGVITKSYSNEYGSYAILQNKSAYGSLVSYANRGVFVTNDRKTVVVQDEVSFTKFQEVHWIAHTASEIYIAEGEKVAYLTDYDADGNKYTLRATIVSRSDLRFKAEKTETGKLSTTYKQSDYKSNGGVYPYSRDGISRLVISAKNVILFNVSVVFEIVDGINSSMPVGYSWTNMSTWKPTETVEVSGATSVEREDPVKETISDEAVLLDMLTTDGTAYSKNLDQFYAALTNIAYTAKVYGEETHDTPLLEQSYISYKAHLLKYNKYQKAINGAVSRNNSLTRSLCGISS